MATLIDSEARARPEGSASFITASDIASKLNIKKADIRRKVKTLEQKRLQYEYRWKEIREYQLPYVGKFDGVDNENNSARRKDRSIYHNCAWDANQVFAAGVMSGLTPPSRKWFRLNFSNPALADNTGIAELLDQRMDIMNDVLEKSNFYNAIHSCYLELAFGQAPLGIFTDSRYGVHFEPYTVGTYCMEAGPDGEINTFCRKYTMTAQQLADKFGIDNLPANIRFNMRNENNLAKNYNVYWYVEPNRMANPEKLGAMYMPYISLYWVEGSEENEWLYVGGFYEFPVPVARFLIIANESYGRGPGWFAEGDSKGIQLLEKDMITAIELSVKPPMQTTADNLNKGINLVPGSKTVVNQPNGIQPLFQVQMNLEHLQAKISELADRIRRTYSADLFLMLDQLDKTMTAREVLERTQEKMQQLGPVVQRLQFEFLGPIIERVYNSLDRAGIFPVPDNPEIMEILQQEEIRIEYISPLAQAQKISGLVNIEQAIAFIGTLGQFDSSVVDKVNFSAAVDKYFEMVGAPAAIKRSEEEYQKMQEEKQKAMQEQQQMAQAQQLASMAAPAAQAAKNATEAANDGNPALQQILGYNSVGEGNL